VSSIQSDVPPNIDWFVYMDSDTMILNQNFELRKLLAGTDPDDALIISPDAENRINAGAFLLRNDELGKMIVESWTADSEAMERTTDQAYLDEMFDEETGYLLDTYATKVSSRRPRMKIIRQCALQSAGGIEQSRGSALPYFEGTYARGDFAVHSFGRPNKLEQMEIVSEGSIGFFSR